MYVCIIVHNEKKSAWLALNYYLKYFSEPPVRVAIVCKFLYAASPIFKSTPTTLIGCPDDLAAAYNDDVLWSVEPSASM